MTTQSFEEFVLRGVPVSEPFRPFVYYDPDGDCIEVFTSNESFYGKWIDHHLTIYLRESDHKVIGFFIADVHGLIDKSLTQGSTMPTETAAPLDSPEALVNAVKARCQAAADVHPHAAHPVFGSGMTDLIGPIAHQTLAALRDGFSVFRGHEINMLKHELGDVIHKTDAIARDDFSAVPGLSLLIDQAERLANLFDQLPPGPATP